MKRLEEMELSAEEECQSLIGKVQQEEKTMKKILWLCVNPS